jgi:hypothetical protein
MKRVFYSELLCLALVLLLLTGCGGGSGPDAGLSADNLNLIFVVSPDLTYQTTGDVSLSTANLTHQGLQRSLLLANYLKNQVLGGENVNGIYALSPMSHLQTASEYPDMAAIGFIQQFALLNRDTRPLDKEGNTYTANSFPIYAAYTPATVPSGVAVPSSFCTVCQGLDFKNTATNTQLVADIISKKRPGFHVFSAPWETISALLVSINDQQRYGLDLPTTFMGSNHIYVISIAPSGSAKLVSYNSQLNPVSAYPDPPFPVTSTICAHQFQPSFRTSRIGGINGAVIPLNINKNQTVYIVRHAEAHPDKEFKFENGNYVAAGQWRALELGKALSSKLIPTPNLIYSIDPAQSIASGINASYVRPSLTLLPYAIANNLPYKLAASFSLLVDAKAAAKPASDFFFTGSTFSNQVMLLGWESQRINPFINALLDSYGGTETDRVWPGDDYDTIWTVKTDASGNLTVDNDLCEGIDSTKLPEMAPLF